MSTRRTCFHYLPKELWVVDQMPFTRNSVLYPVSKYTEMSRVGMGLPVEGQHSGVYTLRFLPVKRAFRVTTPLLDTSAHIITVCIHYTCETADTYVAAYTHADWFSAVHVGLHFNFIYACIRTHAVARTYTTTHTYTTTYAHCYVTLLTKHVYYQVSIVNNLK